jgi:hypothetical protein
VYFSKLDICTSVLPVYTSLHHNVILFVMAFIFNSKLGGTAYFPKLNIFYFSFLLVCTSLHHNVKLPVMTYIYIVVMYFSLDDFYHFSRNLCESCTFKIEYLYFSSSLCQLPRVIGRTSLI